MEGEGGALNELIKAQTKENAEKRWENSGKTRIFRTGTGPEAGIKIVLCKTETKCGIKLVVSQIHYVCIIHYKFDCGLSIL